MKVKSESEVCPTLCDPMDCSLLGSSVHGIFQARVLERGLILLKHKLNLNTDFFSDFDIIIYAVTFMTYGLLPSLLIVK